MCGKREFVLDFKEILKKKKVKLGDNSSMIVMGKCNV
jgi:hypothetical protein